MSKETQLFDYVLVVSIENDGGLKRKKCNKL